MPFESLFASFGRSYEQILWLSSFLFDKARAGVAGEFVLSGQ
jgi:hypothetical protein